MEFDKKVRRMGVISLFAQTGIQSALLLVSILAHNYIFSFAALLASLLANIGMSVYWIIGRKRRKITAVSEER